MHKRARKTVIIANIVAVMILVTLISGCGGLQGVSAQKNAENSNSNNGMRTVEVKKGNVGTIISGSGSFVPIKLTSLFYNDLSGPLKKVYVKTNDGIKAGDTVAEIDPQSITKQIINQNLTVQLSKIRKLQNAESILSSARSLKLAQINLEQATKLNKEKPTDQNSLELAKQQILYDQAVSADKNTKWNKDLADMQYKLDESNMTDLNTKLANSALKSPVDGIVTFVENLSETEMVGSGRVIARIVEPKNIVLQMLATDARYIQNVKNGVLTIGLEKYEVELYTSQPGDQLNQASSDPKTNNRIYLKFGDKMPKITLENIVNATLEINKSNVLIVPKAAVRDVNGKTVVDIYQGNIVNTVDIVRGLEKDGNVEIISGLKEGQTVGLQ
ncbi:MAG: hypothetical protein WA131_08400 [Desulfitobacteriaceae bacterium]